MKTLIVYFSHNQENYVSGTIQDLKIGNTKVVAEKMQDILKCDIFEIKPMYAYPYHYHECTEIAKKELHHNERPKIINIVPLFHDYDTIYLGYPNWWGTMPMCVWTFLESYDFTNKVIYPFCTHEGSGFGNSIQNIKELCPSSQVKEGLAIYGSQVQESDYTIKQWLKEK